jgi:hypothetical protein
MSESEPSAEVKFTYKKGNFYRVIHADGAIGGLSPNGRYIHMCVWSERHSLPKEQVFGVGADHKLEDIPKSVDDIGGVFREIEADVALDYWTARALRKWLDVQIKNFEDANADALKAAEQTIKQAKEKPHE